MITTTLVALLETMTDSNIDGVNKVSKFELLLHWICNQFVLWSTMMWLLHGWLSHACHLKFLRYNKLCVASIVLLLIKLHYGMCADQTFMLWGLSLDAGGTLLWINPFVEVFHPDSRQQPQLTLHIDRLIIKMFVYLFDLFLNTYFFHVVIFLSDVISSLSPTCLWGMGLGLMVLGLMIWKKF